MDMEKKILSLLTAAAMITGYSAPAYADMTGPYGFGSETLTLGASQEVLPGDSYDPWEAYFNFDDSTGMLYWDFPDAAADYASSGDDNYVQFDVYAQSGSDVIFLGWVHSDYQTNEAGTRTGVTQPSFNVMGRLAFMCTKGYDISGDVTICVYASKVNGETDHTYDRSAHTFELPDGFHGGNIDNTLKAPDMYRYDADNSRIYWDEPDGAASYIYNVVEEAISNQVDSNEITNLPASAIDGRYIMIMSVDKDGNMSEPLCPVTDMTVKTAPDKTVYSEGESLDLTGGVVTLSRISSDTVGKISVTKEDVTLPDERITAEGFDPETAGEQTITLRYGDYTAEFTVTVVTYTKVDKEDPSCTVDGHIEYYTGSDNKLYKLEDGIYTEIEQADTIIPATRHIPADAVRENEVTATYSAPGSYDEVVYCSICNEELSRNTVTVPMLKLNKPVVRATPGDKQATLSWDAVTGAAQYRVYRYENGKYTALVNTTGTSYTVTGLTNFKKTGFLVRAINGSNASEYSSGDVVYTTPVGTLAKPKVTVTPGNKQAAVKWSAVSGATSYRVYRVDNGKYVYLGAVTGTSYTATGLANGTRYGFLVRAFNGNVGSAYTSADIVYATPIGTLAKPKVTVTAGNKQAAVKWGAVSGATSYRVYRVDNGKFVYLGAVTGTSYTATGLANGTRYGFLVRAFNGNVGSTYSSADIVYATPFGTLAKPKVTVTAGNKQAAVKWGAVSGATSYRVYRVDNGKYVYLGEVTGTSYTATGLANGTRYGFLVRAFNGNSGSAYTSADIVYTTTK